MSCPSDGHRQLFPNGNPFWTIFARSSHIPQKYTILLNSFEKKLDERFKSLMPSPESEILCFSWMSKAIATLSETHTDVKTLITDLQFPISDWDAQWMDLYLDISIKLLDICIAFNSEISRLDQSKLLLRYALHVFNSTDFPFTKQMTKASTSLDDWMQQIQSQNLRLEGCFAILEALSQSLDLPKGRHSSKEKTLIRAMNGVKVLTTFVCSVFLAAFMNLPTTLPNLQIPEKFLWAKSYTNIQTYANEVIGRRESLKELVAVRHSVDQLLLVICSAEKAESPKEVGRLEQSVEELDKVAAKFAGGLDDLSKQVSQFFQIILSGRDALLCSLRGSDVMQGNTKENKRYL